MTLYTYKAVSTEGQIQKGLLEGVSSDDVATLLKRKGFDLIHATPRSSFTLFRTSLKTEHLIEFAFHLEQMEQAGVPLLDSLRALAETHPQLGSTLCALIHDIESGLLPSQSLEKYPHIFDKVFIGFVRLGEKTGQLALCLSKIQDHLAWAQSLQDQIAKTLRYPLILAPCFLLGLGILMTVMVPALVDFLLTLGHELPWITQVLYQTSLLLQAHGDVFLLGTVLLIFSTWIAYKTIPSWRSCMQALLFWIPLLGSLPFNIALSRLCHALGHMTAHGVDLLEALQTLNHEDLPPPLQHKFRTLREDISGGMSLSKAFTKTNIFPRFVIRMLQSGEDAGDLPRVLFHLKTHYDRKVSLQIDRLISLLEPTLIIIAGLFLVLIVYAVFWPLYDTLTLVDL